MITLSFKTKSGKEHIIWGVRHVQPNTDGTLDIYIRTSNRTSDDEHLYTIPAVITDVWVSTNDTIFASDDDLDLLAELEK